jgi:hypothetical protein
VGAILMLDANQIDWAQSVKRTPNRVVMTMPVDDVELREVLLKMFEA